MVKAYVCSPKEHKQSIQSIVETITTQLQFKNDEYHRALIVQGIEQYLYSVKSYEDYLVDVKNSYRIECSKVNNPSTAVENGEVIVDVFLLGESPMNKQP